METVAIYCEKPVRAYDLTPREGCLLLELECPAAELAGLCAGLAALEPPLPLVSCSLLWQDDLACWQICLPVERATQLEEAAARAGASLRPRREANALNLQGPHFGDRWGLAKEALSGLEEAGVEPLSLMGVTHTLQVLLEPAGSPAALESLGRRFVAPGGGHA